jgi:hypothetical protein
VRAILEAAEASAAELRAEAGAEARGHVERVEGATSEMVARLAELQGELDRLLGALKASASVLSEGLLDMRARVEEMGGTTDLPDVPTAGHSGPEVEAEQAAVEEPPAVEEPAAEEPAAAPTERSTDEEGARLAALNLALGGTPREEAERYLAEHFDLADAAGLLDDVYARVGR